MAVHHAATSPPPCGELALVCAVLLQARKDLTSPRRDVRSEAETFWGSDAVGFWADLLDLNVDALLQAVQG
jgi:hypothetical protein